MALILANCAAAEEFETQDLDDLPRDAAELKEADIALLWRICEIRISLVKPAAPRQGAVPGDMAWKHSGGGVNL
jgi:hypothetical protein